MHRCIAAVLIALTLIVYGRVVSFKFVNFDDNVYVTSNPHVLGGLAAENLAWAWTTFEGALYQPLTWTSLQLDAQLFGGHPSGFHATNLCLHAINVVLLFLILRQMTGATWRSATVAALFAIHPMHVESVAWVSERKDVLVAFFWLLMLAAYCRYVRVKSATNYTLVAFAFAAGLLSKAMIITAPLLLLLLDIWPLRRFSTADAKDTLRNAGWLILEKLPLLLLALAFSLLTLYAVSLTHPVLLDVDRHSPIQRAAVTVVAYGWYLKTTFFPVNLAVVYPPPVISMRDIAVAAAVLLAITGVLALYGRRRPELLVGWLWFAGTLFPIAFFASAGIVAWADRYVYFPHIGLFIALVWGLASVPLWQPLRFGFAAAMLLILAVLTWFQVGRWRNSETLFAHSLLVTHDNHVLHCCLGDHLHKLGDHERAEFHFAAACQISPGHTHYENNYCMTLIQRDEFQVAIERLERHLTQQPKDARAHFLLGQAHAALGKWRPARDHLQAALQHWTEAPPQGPEYHATQFRKSVALEVLGKICLHHGEADQAIAWCSQALNFNAKLASSHRIIGIASTRLGRWREAESAFRAALAFDPAPLLNDRAYLAYALMRQDKIEDGRHEYASVVGFLDRLNESALQLMAPGPFQDLKQAEELAKQACEASDNDARPLSVLAAVRAAGGDYNQARNLAARALSLADDPPLAATIRADLQRYEEKLLQND